MDFNRTAEGLFWRAKQALQEAFSGEKEKEATVGKQEDIETKVMDAAETFIRIAQIHRGVASEYRQLGLAMLAKAQEHEDKATQTMEQFVSSKSANNY